MEVCCLVHRRRDCRASYLKTNSYLTAARDFHQTQSSKTNKGQPNGGGRKGNPMIIAIIWLIALAGVFMMQKIAPKQSAIYAVYVLVVCVIFTIVTLFA